MSKYPKSRTEAMHNAIRGVPKTEEHKKKLSEAVSGEKHHGFGKPLSEETRKKIGEANSGENNYNFGGHLSEETKAKLSESMKGENNPFFGKTHTDETKQRLREVNTGVNSPHYGKTKSKEEREVIGTRMKEWWAERKKNGLPPPDTSFKQFEVSSKVIDDANSQFMTYLNFFPESPNNVYIYYLLDPRDNSIKYVGKANNPKSRLNGHISQDWKFGNTERTRWEVCLIKQDLCPQIIIIDNCTDNNWQEYEVYWKNYFEGLGIKLLNATEGGDGLHNPSEETRKKIGDAHRGEKGYWYGREKPVELVSKISQTLMGHEVKTETRKKLADVIKTKTINAAKELYNFESQNRTDTFIILENCITELSNLLINVEATLIEHGYDFIDIRPTVSYGTWNKLKPDFRSVIGKEVACWKEIWKPFVKDCKDLQRIKYLYLCALGKTLVEKDNPCE